MVFDKNRRSAFEFGSLKSEHFESLCSWRQQDYLKATICSLRSMNAERGCISTLLCQSMLVSFTSARNSFGASLRQPSPLLYSANKNSTSVISVWPVCTMSQRDTTRYKILINILISSENNQRLVTYRHFQLLNESSTFNALSFSSVYLGPWYNILY